MEEITSIIQYISRPIPQPDSYHNFADKRKFLGIPNFLNVVSNLAFLFASFYGFYNLFYSSRNMRTKLIFYFFFLSLFLTSFGSAYYHYNPSNQTLVWDRITTSLSLTTIASALLVERSDSFFTIALAILIILTAPITSLYWYFTEMYYVGDIRPYISTQIMPILLIQILIIIFPKPNDKKLFVGIIFSILARVGEYFDYTIFELTYHLISGHTCKHIFFSLSGFYVGYYVSEKGKTKIN